MRQMRRVQISVIGYDSKLCTDEAYSSAYAVGMKSGRREGWSYAAGWGESWRRHAKEPVKPEDSPSG